jgi:RNA polymerase sigma-70 factor (ECF subfamily)
MTANDQSLLQQWVHDRDAEAFRMLAMRHAAMVYNTSRRILRDPTDAEDVAQECFEALVRAGDKPGAYLGAWLHRVATNLSCTRIEAKRHRKDREDRFAANATPATESYDEDLYAHVDKAIAALPDKLRYPLVAHFLENQTHDAIAESIGVSRQTITYRIGQAVERVRTTLKRRGVMVAAAAFAEFLVANSSEAVPSRLAANLGKLAVAGLSAAPVGLSLAGMQGLVSLKAFLAAAAIVAVGVAGVFALRSEPKAPGSATPSAPAKIAAAQTKYPAGPEREKEPAPIAPPVASAPVQQSAPNTAQPAPTKQGDPKDRRAEVQGRVINALRQPIAGAKVFFEGAKAQKEEGEEFLTTSGEDGSYQSTERPAMSLTPVYQREAGTRRLCATHPDFSPGSTYFALSEGSTVNLEIVLAQGGCIEGTITMNRKPLSGASIGVPMRCRNVQETTKEDGRFRIEHVAPGDYPLIITAVDQDKEQRRAFKNVIVEEGATTKVQVDFAPRTARLEGHVVLDGFGKPRGRVKVAVKTSTGEIESADAQLNPDGSFAIDNLTPGIASLKVEAKDEDFWSSLAGGAPARVNLTEVTLERDSTTKTTITFSNTEVTGKVEMPGKQYLGMLLIVRGRPDMAVLDLQHIMGMQNDIVVDTSLSKPSFSYAGLDPGTYTVMTIFTDRTIDDPWAQQASALYDSKEVDLGEGASEQVELRPTPLEEP